jgi:tetrahydromethanopterin S-methyltransferase subunit F
MVKFSNKPNVRGIRAVVEDTDYKSRIIGRQGRLLAGLINTRAIGMIYGVIIAFVFCLIIPLLVILFGGK